MIVVLGVYCNDESGWLILHVVHRAASVGLGQVGLNSQHDTLVMVLRCQRLSMDKAMKGSLDQEAFALMVSSTFNHIRFATRNLSGGWVYGTVI